MKIKKAAGESCKAPYEVVLVVGWSSSASQLVKRPLGGYAARERSIEPPSWLVKPQISRQLGGGTRSPSPDDVSERVDWRPGLRCPFQSPATGHGPRRQMKLE